MTTFHWILLAILNIPLYWLLAKVFFDDWADFLDCIRFWLTPDIISMFRGEWSADWWASMRLGLFFALCGFAVVGEYHVFFQKADAARAQLVQPAASR